MTSTAGHLFVLRYPSQQQIEVYDTETFEQQRALDVKDLSDNTLSSGMTSDDNCIYVSDWRKDTIYKVDMSDNNKVFSWRVARSPRGLSINASGNLLIACCSANIILEYTLNRAINLVREICLKSEDIELRSRQAIGLQGDRTIVSCWNVTQNVDDVVEVDNDGIIVFSYTELLKSTNQPNFNVPRRFSVCKNECILVADSNNNRIVELNRSSKSARELDVESVVGKLQQPYCLCFDASQTRLFVGEESGRVFVFDNVV